MTQRDDPHAALLTAARALQRDGVSGPGLARLFAAVDAVGDADPAPCRGPCPVCCTIAWEPTPEGERCGHCALMEAYLALRAQVDAADAQPAAPAKSAYPASLFAQCSDATCFCHTGEAPPDGPYWHQEGRTAELSEESVNRTAGGPASRTAPVWGLTMPECAVTGCFRAADLPTGTCHHHSEIGQAPLPFERARMRDGALGGGGDG